MVITLILLFVIAVVLVILTKGMIISFKMGRGCFISVSIFLFIVFVSCIAFFFDF